MDSSVASSAKGRPMPPLGRTGRSTDAAGLITVLTGLSEDHERRKFLPLREHVMRSLRHHGFGRTDQFEVQTQLEGLDEKLRVLNEDGLADALASRLDALERTPNKWTPEILSFLLHLSDRPAAHSNIEDLESLTVPDLPPQLTWADIIAEDPLDETGVWDDIDYAADSSEEDDLEISHEPPAVTEKPPATTVVKEQTAGYLDAHIVDIDNRALEELQRGQFWTSPQRGSPEDAGLLYASTGSLYITELQCIREVLFMLSGLPTSLFREGINGEIIPNEGYTLKHAEQTTLHQILGFFAQTAKGINVLRSLICKSQSNPLMQTFRSEVEEELRVFDKDLAEYQRQLNGSHNGVVISLMQTEARIRKSSRPILQLSKALLDTGLVSLANDEAFKYLEMLYDQICIAQMIGDEDVFHIMARIFFASFKTYLKPLERWMLEGQVPVGDENIFIVKNEIAASNLGSLWHDHYSVRTTNSGLIHAPSFLHVASVKIFNAGKNIVFLQNLGDQFFVPSEALTPTRVDYETVIGNNPSATVVPFNEEFDRAIENWIITRQQSTSIALRKHIFAESGLWKCLDALEYIYFFRDGAVINAVATQIFDKIDRGKEAWNDRYLLTESMQAAYDNISCVDIENLSIRSTNGRSSEVQSRRRSVKIMANMTVDYILPWTIMNIVRPSSLVSYQRIFTFLLQIRRVQYILSRLRILKETSDCLEQDEIEAFYSIRHRLLWQANLLYHYLAHIVIIPCTAKMRERMATAETLDAMVSIHETYTTRLEDQALLSEKLAPIHQAIISILDLAILLSDAHSTYAGDVNFDVADRSFVPHGGHSEPTKRRPKDLSSDDEDSEDDQANQADTSYISFQETAYGERLSKMRERFDSLSSF
ncbi:MAG: hypothetical protein M4579_001502, partial [Chaenotheca gracillima]